MVHCLLLVNGECKLKMAKDRNKKSFARKAPKREPYEKVLIVCEGKKTEPSYLRDAAYYFQIHTANILITGDSGAAPVSVVDFAIAKFEKTPDYDRVYCVFDRDQHPSFNLACQKIQRTTLEKKEGKKRLGKAHFEAITSDPCFEYWLLLHYTYTTKPLDNFAAVSTELKKIPEMVNYQKGQLELFDLTRQHLKKASERAERANEDAKKNNTTNPTTKFYELMEYLGNIRKIEA